MTIGPGSPVSLSTLGDLKRAGYRIVGHCSHPYCGVSRTLKLDDLIERLGPDYVVINETRIARNFLCQSSQCEHSQRGQRGGSNTLQPPT
jgi:hypothetical protein